MDSDPVPDLRRPQKAGQVGHGRREGGGTEDDHELAEELFQVRSARVVPARRKTLNVLHQGLESA